MPIERCTKDGLPGYRYGKTGTCYTFKPGSTRSREQAKKKAQKQGIAIEISKDEKEKS